MPKTRLAPSPTGALHLGNARTFLINWILARQSGWEIVLRIEDLDGPRIKPGADALAIQDLRWLGLDWDDSAMAQTRRMDVYRKAIDKLIESGIAYACVCSRKEVELSASAPHAEDGAARYPGTCRGKFASIDAAIATTGRRPAIRFQVPDRVVEFQDQFAGAQRFNMSNLGDFVIRKADGTPAYQLAVAVDDTDGQIDRVVRGDDLIDSTPRQISIDEALGLASRIPQYFHVPLVVGEDGRRLAKRHGDTRLQYYRDRGVTAGRILALLARWCGIDDAGDDVHNPSDLLDRFDLNQMSKSPIIFTSRDDTWLTNGR